MRPIVGVLLFAFSQACFAQSWPTKPVRVLVGFAPGGSADVSARLTSDFVSKEIGQSVIVENRPGGAGSVAIEALVRGPHDGYTIYIGSDSSLYQPVINPSLAYRVEKDLRPITILTHQPIVIAAHPAPGWNSVADLVKAAKQRPGQIAYALSSPTGTQAVAGAIFCGMARVRMISVPYKGGGQAVVDLVSGQVPVAVLGSAPLMSHAKSGRVKLLAVMSKVRSRALPDVPTLAEMGYPDMDISQWFGAVAPAGTPADVVARLSSAYSKALADAKISERLFNAGLEAVGGVPEEMGRRIASDTVVWAKAAKDAGMAAQ
jgi:tripartite-type tricarboxylate transporter receptor subunit TctC